MEAVHQVYPSYYSSAKAVSLCCLYNGHMSVTEFRAKMKLQEILNKTAERLVEAQSKALEVCYLGHRIL